MRPKTHADVQRLRQLTTVALCVALLVISVHAFEQRDPAKTAALVQDGENRNFDARAVAADSSEDAPAGVTQLRAVDALRKDIPELDATFDPTTGATRGLWNRVGFLTGRDGRSPREIADSYITDNLDALGLTQADVTDMELTDAVYSKVSGATHFYFRQRVNGLSVYNTQLQVNVAAEGRIISVNNSFLPNIASSFAALAATLDAPAAVRSAARHLNVADARVSALGVPSPSVHRETEVQADNLSTETVKARLMVLPVRKGMARLVWNFQIHTLDYEHIYDFSVDAGSGEVWTRFDWVASDQYKVYQMPVESPNHASPAPPADGRGTVVDPSTATASPFGWHDTNGAAGAEFTIMRGNNVHAYDDSAAANAPPAVQPDCGSALDCTFPVDLTAEPSAYRPAAVANLFYWNNIIHDVQYRYGFDEAAGNFQVNNYSRGGTANDDVRAEAQDGGGTNNANFATPPDGGRPRMQMYLWTAPTPDRDGDFDNGIIVHEYGHGISNRLVGGPSNVSCLGNAQQPGEGLSDWWSLAYTARASDTATMSRGVGTYALNQPTTGNGIRALPYTTNTTVNNWTYASIAGKLIPHGVGAVWAQGMWRVYWALVTQHGFSTDLYNATGTAGNQRAMLYVNEGLKNTPCSPTFTQVRDGIIQAATTFHGGSDVCRLWDAFAAFGLGSDAISGGSGSTTPTNGFNKPVACGGTPVASLAVNDVSVTEGHSGTTTATFTATLSAAAGGEVRVKYATGEGTADSGTRTSSGAITIPSSGAATPYPANISVSGMTGNVQQLKVRLNSLTHTFPADIDIVLVGPGGQKVMLMSDVGGNSGISGANLTFQDGATALTTGPIVTGTYAPTDLAPGETMPGSAPAGPYGGSLSVFNGASPNGTWSLYVADDEAGDTGSLASWSLLVQSGGQDYVPVQGQLVFAAGQTSQTFTVTVNGDTALESNETFTVNLSDPAGATIADAQGIGTIIDDDSVPPAATVLVSPLGRVGTVTPTYRWRAVPTATWYKLFVNDGSGNRLDTWYTAAQVGCSLPSEYVCSVTPSVGLNQGDGMWWVMTWNAGGNGPWTQMGRFSMGVPDAPALIGPFGLSQSSLPTYRWYASPGATWYYLWANDSTGNRIKRWYTAAQVGCPGDISICQINPGPELAQGAGIFWIQAWNDLGFSVWSGGSNFTIGSVGVTETWQVSGGMPGATVRLWARVKNYGGSALGARNNVWFRVTLPGGGAAWVGYQPVAGLAAGTETWYFYDWSIPTDAAAGGYQYHAQVFDPGGEVTGPGDPRNFSVGFDSQFNAASIAPWTSVSGTWRPESTYMTAPGRLDGTAASYGASTFRTLDLSVRMWRDSSVATNANHIIVRGTPDPAWPQSVWNAAYYFQYARNGTYSVWKADAGVLTPLQNWTSTTAIVQGSAWNLLRVVAHNATLQFYINGTLVWSGADSTFANGRVGVGFASGDGATEKLWVDYATLGDPALALTGLSDAGAASPDRAASKPQPRVSAEQQALNQAANNAPAGDINNAPEAIKK